MSKWRDVLTIHPACELLPLMNARDLHELAQDIEKNGLRHKVDTYWDKQTGKEQLIDGRNRLDALELLGRDIFDERGKLLSKYSRGGPTNLGSAPDLVAWVISTNIHRRHLTGRQKRDLIAKLLKAKPEASDRAVAKQVKVDHKTVGAVRSGIEATGEIPHKSDRTEASGRKARGRKPKKSKPADAKPASNVTKRHDLDARRLLGEIDAINPAELSDPEAFGESLNVRALRFVNIAARRAK